MPSEIEAVGAAIGQLLDGHSYAVDTGKAEKPASGKDVIRFADGLMSTALCTRFGFMPAPYLVRVEGSELHFRSEMISERQGKMVFTGVISGNRLNALAEWSQVRWYWTVDITLWFGGRLADADEELPVYIN